MMISEFPACLIMDTGMPFTQEKKKKNALRDVKKTEKQLNFKHDEFEILDLRIISFKTQETEAKEWSGHSKDSIQRKCNDRGQKTRDPKWKGRE